MASTYPEPCCKRSWLEEHLFNYDYESSLPKSWEWPKMPYFKTKEITPTDLFQEKKKQD